MAKRSGLPVGRFIKVNSVRVNANGTIDVIVPDNPTRRKKPAKRKRPRTSWSVGKKRKPSKARNSKRVAERPIGKRKRTAKRKK